MIEKKSASRLNQLVHATAISFDGYGILLTGPSGIGKSDLAIRLIDRGSKLIGDDQVDLNMASNLILLNPKPNIAGKIEVRELGIFELDFAVNVPLKLIVELVEKAERFPMDRQTKSIMGVQIPAVKITSGKPSAPIKVEMAVQKSLQMENQSD